MALVFNMVGGSVGSSAVIKKDVNFYDYDGTLVAGYTILEAQALSALPSAPDHSADTAPLTFQTWNYTLAQVKATTSKLNVGATYITADEKTALHITLTAASGLSPTLYLNKSDTSTLSVNWGDGNTSTFTNSGNFNTGSHTYASAGNYVIKLWISNGTGTYGFGNGAINTTVVGGNTSLYRQTLTKTNIGSSVTSISDSAFYSCFSLSSISIPSSVTSIATSAFDHCFVLSSITIPSGMNVGAYIFGFCYSLSSVTIPSGATSIGAGLFFGCYTLSSITIPSSVTSIGDSAFFNCSGIMEYVFCSTTPPTLSASNAFTGISAVCRIKVPAASLTVYRTATNWSTYANYMEGY